MDGWVAGSRLKYRFCQSDCVRLSEVHRFEFRRCDGEQLIPLLRIIEIQFERFELFRNLIFESIVYIRFVRIRHLWIAARNRLRN